MSVSNSDCVSNGHSVDADSNTHCHSVDTDSDAVRDSYTDVRAEQSSVRGHAERGPGGAADREHWLRFGYRRPKPGADNGHGKREFCRLGCARDHGPHPCSGWSGSECADHYSPEWFSGGYVRDLFE